MSKPRLLLADDHLIVLDGLKSILAESFDIIETANEGQSLMEAALRWSPDLILLDVSMPLLSGIEAASRIKAILPEVKLLFFTMHSERSYLQTAFEAGAAGYVLKSAEPAELLDAVQKVLGGQVYVSESLRCYWAHPRQGPEIAKSLKLSSRERQVLQLVAEGRSSKEVATILRISVKTVSFHRENIKRKLGVRSTAELTRNAIAGGFI